MKQPGEYLLNGILFMLLAGCSSIPANQPDLLRARSAYTAAKEKAWVNEYAPVEIYDAGLALERAKKAENVEDLKHLAYLAERKAQVAVAVAERILSSEAITELGREKNRVLREARDTEIDLERNRADTLAAEFSALNAQKTGRGMVLTLGDVLFAFNKAKLLTDALLSIDKLAAFLNRHTERSVLIEGHTDSIGSQSYNLELSQRRAEAVRDALLARGVPFYRIVSKGYGKSYPLAGNDSEEGRQKNRRVDIIILDEGVKAETMLR